MFSAVLGAVTAAGRNNAEMFRYFRPGFDVAKEAAVWRRWQQPRRPDDQATVALDKPGPPSARTVGCDGR
jgi:hypothetical protein